MTLATCLSNCLHNVGYLVHFYIPLLMKEFISTQIHKLFRIVSIPATETNIVDMLSNY